MPPGVEAALGAVVGVMAVCIHDAMGGIKRIIVVLFEKWFKVKLPED